MDILHLVDRLEELFNESKSLPLTRKVIVDEERMLELIDQMRLAIPEEIKSSQQIINQKERIIAQSNEEARRTIELAKEQSTKLVEKDVIVQKAEVMAENIIQRARQETKQINKEADDYAINSLEHLETELGKILVQVRNGLTALKNDNALKERTNPQPVSQMQVNHTEQSE
jgi:vacuolar-type H+-ATPase subunit H